MVLLQCGNASAWNLQAFRGQQSLFMLAAAGLWYEPGPSCVSCSDISGASVHLRPPPSCTACVPIAAPIKLGADMLPHATRSAQSWRACRRQHPFAVCTSQPHCLQVDVLEYYDVFAHSAHAQFMLPAVLRVRMYVQRDHHGRIALSRRNIMLRDGLACQ